MNKKLLDCSVLFVCLGNICRSPTAHGVFEQMLIDAGMDQRISVDSCGTGDWHIGNPPDARSQETAAASGYNLSHLRSRQLAQSDFKQFDFIFAMDKQNLADIRQWQGAQVSTSTIELFLKFAFDGLQSDNEEHLKQSIIAEQHCFEVPDPYYGGADGFDLVLDMIKAASEITIEKIAGVMQ